MTDSPFPPSPVRSSNSSRNDHMGGKQFLPVSKWFRHCEVLSTNNESLRYSPPCLCRQCMTTSPPQSFKTFMIPNLKAESCFAFIFCLGFCQMPSSTHLFCDGHLSFSSTVLLIPLSSSSRTFAHFSFCIFKKKTLNCWYKIAFPPLCLVLPSPPSPKNATISTTCTKRFFFRRAQKMFKQMDYFQVRLQ